MDKTIDELIKTLSNKKNCLPLAMILSSGIFNSKTSSGPPEMINEVTQYTDQCTNESTCTYDEHLDNKCIFSYCKIKYIYKEIFYTIKNPSL